MYGVISTILLTLALCASEAYAAQDYNGTRSNRSAGVVAAEEGGVGNLQKLTASAKKAIGFLVNEEADGDPDADLEVFVDVSVTVCKIDKETKESKCSSRGQCQFGQCF